MSESVLYQFQSPVPILMAELRQILIHLNDHNLEQDRPRSGVRFILLPVDWDPGFVFAPDDNADSALLMTRKEDEDDFVDPDSDEEDKQRSQNPIEKSSVVSLRFPTWKLLQGPDKIRYTLLCGGPKRVGRVLTE
eukprot:CAMPEP_0184324106 /NCGR_PEP_ID=MMETSP1049-20130417/133572_1 /TAXON_ID=77928 /ORGANISM="Proteomonas sulcata, Strain CCMP704" /LENGTH=134 /DNA_ID=CAMNT_0026645795 /DNA_START=26 /DNA_END=430 /DNA_ORIENTATION=+